MLVTELLSEIAEHLHDPDFSYLDLDRLLVFLNSAARDAANEGWYVHFEEDESTKLVSNQWDYPVPPGIVYISQLWLQNPSFPALYDRFIPSYQWDVALDGGFPQVRFDSTSFPIESGRSVKFVGQKHPSVYALGVTTTDQQTLDINMESFLRERTISYAARFMARAGKEFDPEYARLANEAFGISEAFLHSHPQVMRLRPNAIYVPSR